ncbi:MAG TPA: A/G-specific adenine glycosylase [Chthoniobacterales bacterium]|jgi:A/G-specific adenine glycosylase|nr:A/G-specific adenine glycosylase [Chthoniobacterales bacterium]
MCEDTKKLDSSATDFAFQGFQGVLLFNDSIFIESTEFRSGLLAWYRRHARSLPWRESMDPYRILVSELMLQQTQVATVLGYYRRWLDRFPTIGDLADADEASVLCLWQGLGYYRRARNLHQCAKIIAGQFGERFPSTVEELIKLPGVGRYTAGAIVSFAFDRPAPIVDGNIARVLSRLANVHEPIDSPRGGRLIWELAGRFAQGTKPRLSNAALMELGATLCSPRKPLCALCPVKTFCRAQDPELLPLKKKRPAIEQRRENYFFALRQGHVLLEQRAESRWQGLWTLPVLSESPDSGCARSSEFPLVRVRHAVTRFAIHLCVFLREPPEKLGKGLEWKSLASIEGLPMPSPHRRALKLALKNQNYPGTRGGSY